MQLGTEPLAPGAPTWGDTPPAVASTAGTMKAKENSKRKGTSWRPAWSYLQSIRWPSSLVQVSMCNEGRTAEVVGKTPLQALCQAHGDPSGASPWLQQWGQSLSHTSAFPCARCFLALAGLSETRGTQWDRGHGHPGALQTKGKRAEAVPTTPVPFCTSLGGS